MSRLSWLRPFLKELFLINRNLAIALPHRPWYRNLLSAIRHLEMKSTAKRMWKEPLPIDDAIREKVDFARATAEQVVPLNHSSGSIFITPHFGDFLIGIAGIAVHCRNSGKCLWVMAADNSSSLSKKFSEASQEFGFLVASSRAATIKEICHRLKSGDCIVILIDSVWLSRSSRMVPFFGRPTIFMTGAAWLSRKCRATITPFLCYQRRNRINMRFFPSIVWPELPNKRADIYFGTSLYAQWLEASIKEEPALWHLWCKYHQYTRPELIYPDVFDMFCETIRSPTLDVIKTPE